MILPVPIAGLIWQQTPYFTRMSFDEAIGYCGNLELAGYSDWRLPNSKKNSDAAEYYDWHGAGAQRSDPKTGDPADYEQASDMASD